MDTAAFGDCLIHIGSPSQRLSQSDAMSSSSGGSEIDSQILSKFQNDNSQAAIRSLAMDFDAALPSCHAFIHLPGDGAPPKLKDAVRPQKSGVDRQREADTGTQV